MPPRFYAPDVHPARPDVTLPAGESHHLARVLRLTRGTPVDVFDGRGCLLHGLVDRVSPTAATVTLLGKGTPQPEAPCALVVCVSLLKGDAMDAVVRDATVLGAVTIVPMTTARTNVPARRADAGRLHDRWTRVAVAAAKQCGRARLPDIRVVQPLADVLTAGQGEWQGGWDRRLLVEPSAGHPEPGTGALLSAGCRPTVIACGPEGGWDGREVDAARAAGWTCWSLGPFTLRAEQVTLAALAVVRHAWATPDGRPTRRPSDATG